MAGTKRKRRDTDIDTIRTTKETRFSKRQDRWLECLPAFDTEVDATQDLISGLPSEILDNILSFVLLDHDAERDIRSHAQTSESKDYAGAQPHVLLSLAAMSTRFRDLVESFSQRYITKNDLQDWWRYREALGLKPFARLDDKDTRELRRSPRLATKASITQKPAIRQVVLAHLRRSCVVCNEFCSERAMMANQVACHPGCQHKLFGRVLTLTEATARYDLRPYMLLKSRPPGPRAKHTGLPPISYSAIWGRRGYLNGWGMSYRFLQKDVKRIASLVHGDVEMHMEMKRQQQARRRAKKDSRIKKEMKLRYHQDELAVVRSDDSVRYHVDRLSHYHQLDSNADYDSDDSDFSGYGEYDDVHEKLCRGSCVRCWDREFDRRERKYYGF